MTWLMAAPHWSWQSGASLLVVPCTACLLVRRCRHRQPPGQSGGCSLHVRFSSNLLCRKRDGAAVEQLLQLGASVGWSLHALLSICPTSAAGAERVVGPFLRRGIDPLQPGCLEPLCSGSLLMELDSSHVRYGSRAAADTAHVRRYLLDHLQALNAAGQLQLDCKRRAADLVMGAASCGHPLLPIGIMALEECFGAAEGAAAPDPGSPDAQLLEEVLRSAAHAAKTTPLAALLASSLPLPLHMRVRHSWLHVSLLADTALSRTAHPGNCRLLHQAGAPLTADDLYACIDALSHKGVAAVLACGALAVDTSQPVNQAPELFYSCLPGYSCPIHRTLHTLTQVRPYSLTAACAWGSTQVAQLPATALVACCGCGCSPAAQLPRHRPASDRLATHLPAGKARLPMGIHVSR